MTCRHAPGYHDRDYENHTPPAAAVPETPKASDYEIVEVRRVAAHLVVKVLYPNCRKCSYEGNKVIVFLNVTEPDVLRWREIDPHFRDPSKHTGTRTAPPPAARFPASALHSLFTWDDDEAAEKWRLVEAQKYLRAQVTILRTTGPTETVQVRAFVSLPSDRAEGIYRPMVTVLNSEEMMAELMQDARREFLTFRRKYGHLERLRGPLAQLEQALAA